jgi:hypothetical protein
VDRVAADFEENSISAAFLPIEHLPQLADILFILRGKSKAFGIGAQFPHCFHEICVPFERLVDLTERCGSDFDMVFHRSARFLPELVLLGFHIGPALIKELHHLGALREPQKTLIAGRILHDHFRFAVNSQH